MTYFEMYELSTGKKFKQNMHVVYAQALIKAAKDTSIRTSVEQLGVQLGVKPDILWQIGRRLVKAKILGINRGRNGGYYAL